VTSVNFNYSFQSRSPLISGFVDQLLIETGPAGTHSVFEILQTHDQNSVNILLQSTLDSIIDGVYVRTVWRPDRRARWSWIRSAAETRPLTSKWRYTVFPIVFPVEVSCFHLFYTITKLFKIFARNLHILLRIDCTSMCIIHFKCTLLLEDIISWNVGGQFFMAHSVHNTPLPPKEYYYLDSSDHNYTED